MDVPQKYYNNAFTKAMSFISILWLIHFINMALDMRLLNYGIMPRNPMYILGILFAPFLHGNIAHIASNSLGLVITLIPLYNNFKSQHINKIIVQITILSGILIWMFARGASIHMGASALVYGLMGYLPIAAIRYKKVDLMIYAGICMFFLGGDVLSGMLALDHKVSWEGHAMGFVTGIMLAIFEEEPTQITSKGGDYDH
jgi:membrane associated rhomboid family serine protease